MALRDRLQRRPHTRGDCMALFAAVVLVDQVHLDVADLAAATQVVLPNQAVEVDGCGRAGIGLVVGDLRQGGQMSAQLAQHRSRPLQRRSRRHVEHHLELRLVVEGQHLQLHPAQHRQCDGHGDQRQHTQTEQRAVARAACLVEQRAEDAIEQWCQPGRQPVRLGVPALLRRQRLHPDARQPGGDRRRPPPATAACPCWR